MVTTRWSRQELVLVLDFYFRNRGTNFEQNREAIVALSNLLRSLPGNDAHVAANPDFRNFNSVLMRLYNYSHLDGRPGLDHAGRPAEKIWEEFHENPTGLHVEAKSILQEAGLSTIDPATASDEEVFPEGAEKFSLHKTYERNQELVLEAKRRRLTSVGTLACDVCGFDFSKQYGDIGEGFIEAHHCIPVSDLGPDGSTHVDDLALVCSNCHKMLHRRRPWLGVNNLKDLLMKTPQQA